MNDEQLGDLLDADDLEQVAGAIRPNDQHLARIVFELGLDDVMS